MRGLSPQQSVRVVLVAGCMIALIGFGARAGFGLFLEPMTTARGWSRETFALALAWQNLFWGLGTLVTGVLADRFGPRGVMLVGAAVYAVGILGMATAESSLALSLTGGVLVGCGVACTSFSIALAAMARVVGEQRRSFALGVGTAAGSLGQVIFSPLTQAAIGSFGWNGALHGIALSVLCIVPFALMLPHGGGAQGDSVTTAAQTPRAALQQALQHRGYVLLTLGFFVCGFHVAFIVVHFPAYIGDLGLSPTVGAWALALLGLFNIVGSLFSGYAGQRWSKRISLCWIYLLRAVVISAMLLLPVSATTILGFAALMGLLWLSTVPLTTGIVAQVFGVRFMATLFGCVFMSHQLGAFIAVWLGGRLYDLSGSYAAMWWLAVGLSLVAAALHWSIDERPLARVVKVNAVSGS